MFGVRGKPRERFGLRLLIVFETSNFPEAMLKKERPPNLTPTQAWLLERDEKVFEFTFIDGFRNGLHFGSTRQDDTITRPYAHAGLAPREAQTGRLSDEKVDISCVFKRFSKKMLLWLQRRAPTEYRTAATASLFSKMLLFQRF